MKIKEALKKGAVSLDKRDTAFLDAEVLLAFVLGEERDFLISHGDDEMDDGLFELYCKYCERVIDGEPVAYIINEKEFYGLDFFVDDRVLVPRPETELLVEKVIGHMRLDDDRRYRILDLGTGSGNIAISIAKTCFDEGIDCIECVDALDISEGALEVARINAQQHGVTDTVNFFQSDLLEILDTGEKYDIVVANLPYIGKVSNRVVDKGVEEYEPECALFGGDDGLELYKKMFQEMGEKNTDFGIMFGEFCFGQLKDVEEMLNKYFEQKWSIEKDLEGVDRIFIVKF